MPDVRDATDPVQMIADLQAQIDDMKTTMSARVQTGQTGDIESTLRTTPKAGTLFLNGQTVNVVDYPILYQWILDQGLFVANGFINGTTTFTLPDFRGRIMRGVDSIGGSVIFEIIGADTKTIASGNMPSHTHTVSVADHGSHSHGLTGGTSDNQGGHGGHFPANAHNAPAGVDLGLAAWNDAGAGAGGHTHNSPVFCSGAGAGSHSASAGNTGTGTAFNVCQESIGVNVAIWT